MSLNANNVAAWISTIELACHALMISQGEAARAMGINYATWQRWRNRESMPRPSVWASSMDLWSRFLHEELARRAQVDREREAHRGDVEEPIEQ